MKLAVIVPAPPWNARVTWYVRHLFEAFKTCTLIALARGPSSVRSVQRMHHRYGLPGAVPRLLGAVLYKRYTRRIERVAQRGFADKLAGLQADVPGGCAATFDSLGDAAFAAWLDDHSPDVVVPIAGGLVGVDLLSRCRWVRYHHGITPAIRGVASPFWAIHDQRPDWLGGTVQDLVERIDAGPILFQQGLPAEPNDDLATIHFKLDLLICDGLVRALKEIEAGTSRPALCDPSQGVYRSAPGLAAVLRFPARERRFFGSAATLMGDTGR